MGGDRLREVVAHEGTSTEYIIMINFRTELQCFTTPVSFIKDNNLYSLQTEWWCIMQMINKSSWGGNNNIRSFTQRCFLGLTIKDPYKVVQNSSWEESSYKSTDNNEWNKRDYFGKKNGKKESLHIFLFLHAVTEKKETLDLFFTVKEGEEDTTYYSQRLNVKSALSTDICTRT